MQDLLNQLERIALKGVPDPGKQENGSWYFLSDYETGIKAHAKDSWHPCFLPGGATLKNGRVDLWFRSASRGGDEPQFLKHLPHNHVPRKKCPCKVEGHITLRGFKSIPASVFVNSDPQCYETDQIWLQKFQMCRDTIFPPRVKS